MPKRWDRIPPAVILFLFFFSIYAFTMSGVILYGDEVEKYRVAQSIVDRQEFSFRPTAHRNETGVSGHTYSIYELGQTVFQVPFYALARIVHAFFPQPDVNEIGFLLVGFLNPVLTALTCVLFFYTSRALAFSWRTALGLTLVFGLATVAWPYSRSYTREPLLMLLLLVSFYAALRFHQTNRRTWVFVTGLAVGYLTFTKLIQGTAVVIFLLYILWIVYRECRRVGADKRRIVWTLARVAAIFAVPVVILLVVQSLYGWSRFGTFYSGIGGTKYNPIDWIFFLLQMNEPSAALVGLLVSPAKSVFLYSLPALMFLVMGFKFWRRERAVAAVMLALVVAAFGTASSRPDWDGGTWWGPRYLVQITPFLILPLGVIETLRAPARRVWLGALGLLALGGLLISALGAFSSERDYLDVMGYGTTLLGQVDFFRHGAFDSLVLYTTPESALVQINPYGIVLLGIAALTGLWIARALRVQSFVASHSRRVGLGVLGLALLVQIVALIVWIVIPYDRVQAKKADTLFRAGDSFAMEGRVCEAVAMSLLSLERETRYQAQALARVEALLPRARGVTLTTRDLMAEIESPAEVDVEEDSHITIAGTTALKLSAPKRAGDVIARIQAQPHSALPNAQYELSGWVRAENVYGRGYGSITVSEDNGRFEHIRSTDLVKWDETLGWSYFHRTFTTLPTTQRLFIATWLWKTPGTIWVADLRLARISETNPPSTAVQPCKCFPHCADQVPGRSVGPYP
ncbi:MAG: phospholipid carrier-dependent glycosyltransferase [Chloroflexi bacterium]|nr:phospholipid carrier-dependent glycosyltransferase [Chloroflexota bacterium]